MLYIKDVHCEPRMACLGQPFSWSMTARLRVIVVVRMRLRAIPPAIFTTRKAIHGYEYGAPLGGLPATGSPLHFVV